MIAVILQILAVISALLSLSWLAVTYKAQEDSDDGPHDPPRPFTAADYILEMLWNTLAISCRVIALSLFGSQYRYWFAGVVVMQCLFWTACIAYIEREYISDWKDILEMLWNVLAISCRIIALSLFGSQYRYWFAGVVVMQCLFWTACIAYIERELISDWKDIFIFRLTQGLAYTFNITVTSNAPAGDDEGCVVTYPWYIFYWFITMLVNTILISIWFTTTADTQLWYKIPATTYVIVGYFVSLFVKTFHTNIRKHNRSTFDWEWKC